MGGAGMFTILLVATHLLATDSTKEIDYIRRRDTAIVKFNDYDKAVERRHLREKNHRTNVTPTYYRSALRRREDA